MVKPQLQYLDWDSEQLGIRCGLIDGTELEDLSGSHLVFEHIRELIEKHHNIEYITIKLHQNCIRTVNALIQMGAVLIDTELTFLYAKDTKKDFHPLPESCRVVFCKQIDSQPFLALAEEMRLSRFFLDPNIADEQALYLWKTSIKNHCEGFADQLAVAYFNDEPCGLITLKFKDNIQVFLHIVGVLKYYQGKKIGKCMLTKIIERYAERYNLYVETQSINIPAQITYQKAGFMYHTLKYILHYWHHEYYVTQSSRLSIDRKRDD